MEQLACNFDPAFLLVFSQNVYSSLIYYSHFGPIIVSLLIGILVLFSNSRSLANRVLFALAMFFSIWVYFDLILWATEKSEYSMFFWSIIVPIELLIYATGLYLVSIFANGGKDISLKKKFAIAGFFIPILLFTHTSYNLLGFDATNCDRAAIEGPLIQYLYFIEPIFIGWVALIAIRGYRRLKDLNERRQLLFITIGVLLFLLTFTAGNLTIILSLDWSFEQYKLFGMPILVAFIAYSMVKFKTFNSKIIGAQALIAALAIAVLSLLFLQTIPNIRIIAGITFLFVCVLGYILVRSVQRIQELAKNLEISNEQLSEFMSLATHEIRNPATFIKGFTAGALEGDIGELTPAVKDGMQKMFIRATDIINLGNQYLNKSKLELNQLKYEFAPVELGKIVEDLVHEFQPAAVQQNITITADIDKSQHYTVNADSGKIKEVLGNLIDNSIKYTPKGSVMVSITKGEGTMTVKIADTGVGIPTEVIPQLFKKFSRADAQKMNLLGSGLGLYLSKIFIDAHHGRIWVESEGEGKGSTFYVELPTA